MFKLFTLIAIVLSIGFSGSALAQDSSQRTKDLVAALDKTKYKKKEKANLSVEVYVDIKNVPAVRDPFEYGGIYESDGYRLDLQVAKGGSATGGGYDTYFDNNVRMNFTLKDARVEGALLTATKVYESGEAIPFEAVFVNRTSRAGTSPDAVTTSDTKFGVAFLQSGATLAECETTKALKPTDKNATVADAGLKDVGWTNRVFLAKK